MRRGLGKGLGMGYKNIAPLDSHIHSLSAKGVSSWKKISDRKYVNKKREGTLYIGDSTSLGKTAVSVEVDTIKLGDVKFPSTHIYEVFPKREQAKKFANELMKSDDYRKAMKVGGKSLDARGQMFSMYGSKWKVIEKGKDTVLLRNNKGEGLTITREEYDDYRPRDVHVEMPNYIYRDGKVIYKGTDRVMFGSLHYAKNYIKSLNPKAKKEAEIVLGAKGWKKKWDSKEFKEFYKKDLRYQKKNPEKYARNQWGVIEVGKERNTKKYAVAMYNPFRKQGDIPDLILRYDSMDKAVKKAEQIMVKENKRDSQ